MHLTGKRIILKLITTNEATDIYISWLNDKEVTKYMVTRDSTLSELVAYVTDKLNDKSCLFLGIFTLSNEHIGNIKIDPIDYQLKTGILGMMIGEKHYWNRGYGNEALSLLLNHLFLDKKWNKIELGVEKEHVNAIRLYKKNGFKVVGQKDSTLWMSVTCS